ncbi:MAG: four helix bundle protein [Hyphomonadaceae bacterium]|nr:four helix bundle protein [Hyphomonadaceae bacterium]
MANSEWRIGIDVADEINSYRDLTVWRDGVALAALLYRETKSFPREELYGLTSQIRRAAASVPVNIAEGHGREHTKSFMQGLRVAQGSLKELETHLYLAKEVEILSEERLGVLMAPCESLGKRLRSLIRSLQAKLEREG